MSESTILVPIKLEALAVDKATSGERNWKDLSLDYETLPGRMGILLDAGDVNDVRQGLCEPGVHLHWALPAALTNGIYIDGKMIFPAVPNRWLITRTQIVKKGESAVKKWLIESDYISDSEGKSQWVVQNADGSYSSTFIGCVTELDKWKTERKRAVTPLTAVAPGNAAFAAVYQSCRNVFGFYDQLKDTDTGTFSYLVTGWYSDTAIDPLNQAEEAITKNLRDQWLLTDLKQGSKFPSDTLCHGFIHSVKWDPKRVYRLPNQDSNVNIGIGLTAIEAKAVQLSRQTGAAEQLLSAYLYDALKDVVNIAEIETLVDNRAFVQVDGGTLWEIKRTESDAADPEGKQETRRVFPDESRNPGLSALFKELNLKQRELDRFQQERKSLLIEFRAMSDKMILNDSEEEKYLSTSVLNTKREQIKNDIRDTNESIEEINLILSGYLKEIDQMEAFNKGAEGKTINPEFELQQKKMPRFWRPNDPVIVLSGPGGSTSSKYKSTEGRGKLKCRRPADLISGIILKDEEAIEKTIVPKDPAFILHPAGSLTAARIALIHQLYCETILLDPMWSEEWAYQYYGGRGSENVSANLLGDYLSKVFSVSPGVPSEKFRGAICFNGVVIDNMIATTAGLSRFLDEIAILKWEHPWTPVHMIWSADWLPNYNVKNKSRRFIQNDWVWQDKKYQYKGEEGGSVSHAIPYSGKVILSDAVTGILQTRLPEGIQAEQHISQSLGSFSDALIMRRQSIQLPLYKPLDDNEKLFRDTSHDNYLTNENYFFPNTEATSGEANHFFPIRAGDLIFRRVWITDAFGQIQRVIDKTAGDKFIVKGPVFIAGNLKSASVQPLAPLADSIRITLSPRIIQPARLLFRFRPASRETQGLAESSSDPGSTPLCGWLLPDYLDQSLTIYETSGKCCGSLKMISDPAAQGGIGLIWNNPPGEYTVRSPETAIENPFLLDFVLGLFSLEENGGGYALTLLNNLCLDRSVFLSTSSGQQTPGAAGLMGQPVALVRAALKFELQGLPVQPQGWLDSMTEESKSCPPGLSGYQFPVSLGDTRNSKDGLIGYFTDETGFKKLHVAHGTPAQQSDYFSAEEIQLSFDTDLAPVGVTLLMDTRGGIQADCGLLPSKFIDLPQQFIDAGLKKIELNLLVAPFLGAAENPNLPVSAEPDSHWIWLQKNRQENWLRSVQNSQDYIPVNEFKNQQINEGYLVLTPGIPPDTDSVNL